jgi:hypothetical protein
MARYTPSPYISGQKFENREVIPVFVCPIFRIAKRRGYPLSGGETLCGVE